MTSIPFVEYLRLLITELMHIQQDRLEQMVERKWNASNKGKPMKILGLLNVMVSKCSIASVVYTRLVALLLCCCLCILSGCTTNQPIASTSVDANSEILIHIYQDEIQKLKDIAEQSQRTIANLQKTNETLIAEKSTLQSSNAVMYVSYTNAQTLMAINDSIQEKKDQLLPTIQSAWTTNYSEFLNNANVHGSLLDYKLNDALIYKNHFVVTTTFITEQADNTGIIGLLAIYMDPFNNYEMSHCEVLSQSLISREELQSLKSGNKATEATEKTTANNAATTKALGGWMTDETKNKIVQGAVAAGTTWFIHKIMTGDQ